MSIIVRNEQSDYYRVPPGTYVGRCYSVIDFGTYLTSFQGKDRRRHEVRITWEIPSEVLERDGVQRPASISKTYTLSLNEKATLRHDLEAWRGKAFAESELEGFDLSKLLGAPCTLTVTEKPGLDGKMRAIVAGVGKLSKGMQCTPQFNPNIEYSVDDGQDSPVYQALPDWAKEKISRCQEWAAPPVDVKQPAGEVPEDTQPEDDVPF